MLHHLAPHNSPPRVPSRNRVSTHTGVARYAKLIVDAMYWMGELYECEANQVMVEEVKELAQD